MSGIFTHTGIRKMGEAPAFGSIPTAFSGKSMSNFMCWGIILAAGQGRRMSEAGLDRPKQYLQWKHLPLWMHSAKVLAISPTVQGLVFVFPPDDVDALSLELTQNLGETLGVPWRVASGGERRQDSVSAALAILPPVCTHVIIHDAARPFVSPALVSKVFILWRARFRTAIFFNSHMLSRLIKRPPLPRRSQFAHHECAPVCGHNP